MLLQKCDWKNDKFISNLYVDLGNIGRQFISHVLISVQALVSLEGSDFDTVSENGVSER